MYNVVVLMSTYNGEKYLKQQINSILSQIEVNVFLMIRDDGSSDKTKFYLEEYSKMPNVDCIFGNNLGYANSFLTLLKNAPEADFYSFADQDDIWECDKLIKGIEKIRNNPHSVYASALKVVDQDENFIYLKNYVNMRFTIGSILSRTRLAGCTMIIDRELKVFINKDIDEILEFNNFNYGHDGWILLYSLLYNGNIVIDDVSYIKYRRHSNTNTNIGGGLQKRLKNELKIFINKDNKRQSISRFLLDRNNELFNKECLIVLSKINTYKNTYKIRMQLIFGNIIDTNIGIVDIKNKIAVFLGRY